jgi:hypothetical protein
VERVSDTRDLVRKLKAIRDPRMRALALGEFLAQEPAVEIIEVLHQLITRVQCFSDSDDYAAADTLTATLSEASSVSYEVRAGLYSAARAADHDDIARLFFDASPVLTNPEQGDKDLAPERDLFPRGPSLTLGERKAVARAHRREVIDHVVRDPHPEVVTILLDNPHITERDVIVIASRRPVLPAVLEVVAGSARWRPRYSVKRALVMNPHTPVHLAVRMAITLRASDLRAVAGDANLAAALREQAEELLSRRRS